MGRPAPKDPTHLHPRQTSDGQTRLDATEILLQAYKKHVEELRGIEARQSKVIALILGILSAAGTLFINGKITLEVAQKVYVSLLAIVVVYIGQHAIGELHDFRIAVRDLLVRCEIALRFYENSAFLNEEMLYTDYEKGYPTRGNWMKQDYWIVWLVSVVFLLVLWQQELISCLQRIAH
jgi:hypothetical protein